MRTVKYVLLAAMLIAALTTAAEAAVQTMPGKAGVRKIPGRVGAGPAAVAVTTYQAAATIASVDTAKRTVTLRMADGSTRTLKVHKDVVLQMLKKGDMVQATWMDALAVAVRKTTERPGITETTTIMLAPTGRRPAVVEARTVQITGKIRSMDISKRTVTMTGPAGRPRTLKVGGNVNLSKLKVGDNVVVRFTEAAAISLQKTKT